jgi:hypothetical protein
MAGGGLMQLVACGAQDEHLTKDPEVTYFKSVWHRYSNFSVESIQQTMVGSQGFGKKLTCSLSRNGDLVTNLMLEVTLPKLTPRKQVPVTWIRNVGHYLVRSATVEVGGQVIDTQTGEWMHCWNQLTREESKTDGYERMIGEIPELTQPLDAGFNGCPETKLYIPLRFWFCDPKNPGSALPLLALQYHEVKITIHIEELKNLVVSYDHYEYRHGINVSGTDASGWIVDELKGGEFYLNGVLRDDNGTGDDKYGEEMEKQILGGMSRFEKEGNDTKMRTYGPTNAGLLFIDRDNMKDIVKNIRKVCEQKQEAITYYTHWAVNSQKIYGCLLRRFNMDPSMTDAEKKMDASGNMVGFYVPKKASYTDFKCDSNYLNTELYADYIYLDNDERRRFAQEHHEYLITQVQSPGLHTLTNGGFTSSHIDLMLNHPVKEIMFLIRDDQEPQPSEYAHLLSSPSSVTSPIESVGLVLNGHHRFSERDGSYFDCVQPYMYHTRTPERGIHVYSFALKPEEHQPSGTCNFSRIDNSQLTIKLKQSFSRTSRLAIYAHSYNILRVMSGLGGLAYSN